MFAVLLFASFFVNSDATLRSAYVRLSRSLCKCATAFRCRELEASSSEWDVIANARGGVVVITCSASLPTGCVFCAGSEWAGDGGS